MLKRLRRQGGFTLIELLICTAILSTALVIVYRPMLRALDTFRYGDEREEAERLLERQMMEFRESIHKTSRSFASSETRTLLGRDKPFEYRRIAKPLTSDGELYRIDCQISWKRAGTMKRLMRSFDAYIPKYTAA